MLGDLGRFSAAVGAFRQALAIEPRFPPALHNLGMALMELGDAGAAAQAFREVLTLAPHVSPVHADLGAALLRLGKHAEAEASYRRAAALEPTSAAAHLGIANALRRQARFADAELEYRCAIELDPKDVAAHCMLAVALTDRGRLDEAQQSLEAALRLDPRSYLAHANSARMLLAGGRLDEAEASFRQALALQPNAAENFSNLLYMLNFAPGREPAEIAAEHMEFGRRFSQAVRTAYENPPDSERRLRIGYVSGDFRLHSVAFFIAPLLAHHDKSAFEVFCYSNRTEADATTQRLRSHADHWREVFGLQDDALAELIRRDRIDVLIDLAGHTAKNRLPAFARKPAPVQATWLGYLNTTGLGAMDWRITDAHATPQGALDRLHSEKLARLPDSQWCYEPPAECPALSPAPSAKSGVCTFAAFSTAAKVNDRVIEAWARVLRSVPHARLMFVVYGLAAIPSGYRERFTRLGIDEQRLQILVEQPFDDYLALHGAADIVLDTFPYAGGTTTCHALWMGVPVVSLAGGSATSRGGASLLHTIGLPELVAESEDRYVEIALSLAGDAPRLAALRAGMRDRMRASALMDPVRFARNFESACRAMWRDWCMRK